MLISWKLCLALCLGSVCFSQNFQYLVSSFMQIAAVPATAACGTLRSRVSGSRYQLLAIASVCLRALLSSRIVLCRFPGPPWRFSESLQLEIKFRPRGERPSHCSPLSAYLTITPPSRPLPFRPARQHHTWYSPSSPVTSFPIIFFPPLLLLQILSFFLSLFYLTTCAPLNMHPNSSRHP